MQATLVLEDGAVFRGRALGAPGERMGEVVFNTAMTGYEEVITDPSYLGQIVVFTASHIGNTGITGTDAESFAMHAEAMVCRHVSKTTDNPRARTSLLRYLEEEGKLALEGIDTRALVFRLRRKGCLRGILSALEHDPGILLERLKAGGRESQSNIVNEYHRMRLAFGVSGDMAPRGTRSVRSRSGRLGTPGRPLRVAVVDCGIKRGILEALEREGCQVHLFPPTARSADIEAIQPDGLFFSNGPGDPRVLAEETEILPLMRDLLPRYPSFGICLGHQLMGLAFGARVTKLPFGHHAVNHPVARVSPSPSSGNPSPASGGGPAREVFITSQNHNFVVDISDVGAALEATHVHLNDGTLAGMRHRILPLFSVQFHPECNPGPRDASGLFAEFVALMEGRARQAWLPEDAGFSRGSSFPRRSPPQEASPWFAPSIPT